MSAKDVKFAEEARSKMLRGVDLLTKEFRSSKEHKRWCFCGEGN